MMESKAQRQEMIRDVYKLASKAHSMSWPPTANKSRLILYIDSFAQSNPGKKQDS